MSEVPVFVDVEYTNIFCINAGDTDTTPTLLPDILSIVERTDTDSEV